MDTRDLVHRLERLEHLIGAYGCVLTASEFERPLPGLVSVLVSEGMIEAEAVSVLKEILQRGGMQLLTDLEDLERAARQAKDPEVFAMLNRVRQAFRFVSRYNAAALLRRLEQPGLGGPAARSLLKEVQTFQHAVARIAPGVHEVEEVFAEDEPGPPAPPPEVRATPPAEAPPEDARADHGSSLDLPTIAFDISVPDGDEVHHAGEADPTARPNGDLWTTPAAPEHPSPPPGRAGDLDWLRDGVDAFNEMLHTWAFERPLEPEDSPLVRRGRLTVEQCRSLYRDLLQEAGPLRLVRQCRALTVAPGGDGEEARAIRGRMVDGAVGAIPRLVGLLSAGGRFRADLGGVPVDTTRLVADLIAYLREAADLYEEGSPLRDRLLFLAGEVHTAAAAQ